MACIYTCAIHTVLYCMNTISAIVNVTSPLRVFWGDIMIHFSCCWRRFILLVDLYVYTCTCSVSNEYSFNNPAADTTNSGYITVQYNIIFTYNSNFEGITSVPLRAHKKHPYLALTGELWVSFVSYVKWLSDIGKTLCSLYMYITLFCFALLWLYHHISRSPFY